jgi:hypothetical protein
MTLDPYAPRTPALPTGEIDTDAPLLGTAGESWHWAKKGARLFGIFGAAFSLFVIIPVLALTAFGLGSGRGFGLSSYFFLGIGVFLLLAALGGVLGASIGLLKALVRRAGSRGADQTARLEALAVAARIAHAENRRRRSRLWPWLMVVPLLVVLPIAFYCGWDMGKNVDSRLAEAVAAADQDDPNWRLDDLLAHRDRMPDSENSAIIVTQVATLIPANWPANGLPKSAEPESVPTSADEAFEELGSLAANVRLGESAARLIRGELKSHDAAIGLARSLANYRRGRYDLKIGRAVIDTPLPLMPQARVVARLLAADSAIRAHDDDIDGALDSCRAIVATGRSLGDEPFLISHLVRMAIMNMALKASSRVLGQGDPTDAALARMQELLLDELKQPLLVIGVKGERALAAETIRRVAAGEVPVTALSDSAEGRRAPAPGPLEPWEKLLYDFQLALSLDSMTKAVTIARQPARKRDRLWESWEANRNRIIQDPLGRFTGSIALAVTPAVTAASNAFSRYETELGAHAILLAAERHRRKFGNWPDSVAAIDRAILASAPADPFSGRPYQLVQRDSRLVIYSIGPNGQNELGEFNPRAWMREGPDDLGASAWDISLRAQSHSTNEDETD